jgi:hypothetical protein
LRDTRTPQGFFWNGVNVNVKLDPLGHRYTTGHM